ncbi:hypothetical protein HWV62_14036 [Athelia sp. TMB]|nr:hypothetical protein HWV62_14036 [Athelia sp. TMB]
MDSTDGPLNSQNDGAPVGKPPSPTPADPVRSDLWYDDGNIILQAENTRFKVYRGILVENSTVFRDMFSLPQPPGDADMVEGCPLVRLYDSAEEVGYVMEALFRHRYLEPDEKMTFSVLEALLCLGRKYDIRRLQVAARKRIFAEFPVSLEEYDALNCEWIGIDPPDIEWSIQLLAIARRAGLLSVLPAVFYAYCVSDDMFGLATSNPMRSVSPSDHNTCLRGHHIMCGVQAETTFAWAYGAETRGDCSTYKRCEKTLNKYLITRFLPIAKDYGLESWSEASAWLHGNLCANCMKVAQEKHEAGRKQFWQRLPGLFNLPSWEELAKEREDMYVLSYLSHDII